MKLRVGTRRSELAGKQAELVVAMLHRVDPSLDCEIERVLSTGDLRQSLPDEERLKHHDKQMWVDGFQRALRADEIDLAVHSSKDVPVTLYDDLILTSVGGRDYPEDCFILRQGLTLAAGAWWEQVPDGMVIGSASKRRAASIRCLRRDLEVVPLTGNVDTRLRKLDEDSRFFGAVLARAGVQRLGRANRISQILPPDSFVPAMNQGVLAVEWATKRDDVADYINRIIDPAVHACWLAERACIRKLGADCHSAVGVYATLVGGNMKLLVEVLSPVSDEVIRAEMTGDPELPNELGDAVAEELIARGATRLLCSDAKVC